jgi:hypothetical protein
MGVHVPPARSAGARVAARLASRAEAFALLKADGRTVLEVIHVDTEGYPASVLYLGMCRCAMTSWLWSVKGQVVVRVEPGFAAVPMDVPPAHDGCYPA